MPTARFEAEASFDVRVYYEDTDAGGVVFYANYLKFMERARTEWLRELGVSQSLLSQSEKRIFVVVKAEIAYRKPAKLDDLLTIRSCVTRLGKASIHFAQRVFRGTELLAQGTIEVCCVDVDRLRPSPMPAAVRSKLESIQE